MDLFDNAGQQRSRRIFCTVASSAVGARLRAAASVGSTACAICSPMV